MTPLTFMLVWYILGAVGCALGVKSDLNRGIDFSLSDLMLCIVVSFFGPVSLIIGVCEYSKYSEHVSPTLIKGKK